jgi:hypothetical protein
MGFSHQDWHERQGRLVDINLDRIRFGHRMDSRKPLNVTSLGEERRATEKDQQQEDPGLAKYQRRLW